MDKNQSIITCKDVSTDRLKDISFELRRKQIMTIVGPSGAGKSSLLFLLNRLEEPISGKIYYLGQNIKDIPVTQLRCEIGMVFQSAYLFDGTAEENIQYGPKMSGKLEDCNVDRLLDLVDLPKSFKMRHVTSLSGGEQQRVAIARTFANKPSVLLLDEATSALDIKTTEHIEELLIRLRDEKEISILMVTHNLKQAERMGSQTLYMEEGKLIERGMTTRMFAHPETNHFEKFLKE
ncbi:phosphate ABC transporter ATP-binding protein [Pseudalkalibacillus salsuginis]|uniref:ABC transporter ATP-binding protein n=1 Tax=Pseudalkalibacillus salsuginis TaxID=2910972 RepID=UPI001F45CE93|nr:phosphate ABC transporter ATP-binding protein [Pseudalkalibacillus salsuginis]MCF6408460.1 phosphate ABC transporter ATP-binding protein [Pseudalkalibacillus salsuginis]